MNMINLSNRFTAKQLAAINNVATQLKNYMAEILPVYRAATPEKQAELRAHNFILNTLLTIMGE